MNRMSLKIEWLNILNLNEIEFQKWVETQKEPENFSLTFHDS